MRYFLLTARQDTGASPIDFARGKGFAALASVLDALVPKLNGRVLTSPVTVMTAAEYEAAAELYEDERVGCEQSFGQTHCSSALTLDCSLSLHNLSVAVTSCELKSFAVLLVVQIWWGCHLPDPGTALRAPFW